jgi:hypothetical protein
MIKKRQLCSMLIFLFFLIFLSSSSFIFSWVLPDQSDSALSQQEETEKIIHSGPADITEETGILFFLGWVWLSIFVLIYFLSLKIKETDRLYQSGYFASGKENECQKD